MGDELVELDLDFGGVVGEETSRGPVESNHDPFFDVDEGFQEGDADEDDDDNNYAEAYGEAEAAGGLMEEEEADTDDEGYYQPPTGQDEVEVEVFQNEEDAKEDEDALDMQSKVPAKIYNPPSLLHLTTQMVSRNLEKYPPGAIGLLSENHWEGVVKARVANKKESSKVKPTKVVNDNNNKSWITDCKAKFSLDCKSQKKMLPALSEKYLLPIENHKRCVHLSKCKAADELLWKAIVDYNFGGMNRPQTLEIPCDLLKERLRGWGEGLLRVMECPMSFEEYLKEFGRIEPEVSIQESFNGKESSSKKKRAEEGMEDLFGEESDQEEEKEPDQKEEEVEMKSNVDSSDLKAYNNHLQRMSKQRTQSLQQILHSLQQSPMDITLLAETEVGKCASKAVKCMKNLKKEHKDKENEGLLGYPQFWVWVNWGQHNPRQTGRTTGSDIDDMTQLEFLQQLLQDWKDMASNAKGAASAKKRKHSELKSASTTIATFGKDKMMSLDQHRTDMKLLHSSPDWRSLHQCLRKRKDAIQQMHGDNVRARREKMASERSKVGKVVLKRAVGRVRGGGNAGAKQPSKMVVGTAAATGQSLRGPMGSAALSSRKEAILSKSRGSRARSKHDPAAYSRGGGGGKKMSQIRQETKVIAGIAGRPSAAKAKSGFGASIASASFGASVASVTARKNPTVNVHLKNGKQMRLPPQSSVRGKAKMAANGIFSTLQKKENVKARKEKEKASKERAEAQKGKIAKLRRQQRQNTQHSQMLERGQQPQQQRQRPSSGGQQQQQRQRPSGGGQQQRQRPSSGGSDSRGRSSSPAKTNRRGGSGGYY